MKCTIDHKYIEIDHDYDYIPDHLGTWSNEKGEFAIEHNPGDNRTLNYFNADNVENMEQALENYKIMLDFENEKFGYVSVKAVARIKFDYGSYTTTRTLESCGLYGVEDDHETDWEDIKKEFGNQQMYELDEMLEGLKTLTI